MYSPQNTIFTLVVSSALALSLFLSCSAEQPEHPVIQGHITVYEGVPHANAADRGERYCHLCHGAALAGGEAMEPSCFQCHGKNWRDDDPNLSWATTDHTVDHGGFLHQPGLQTPGTDCVECHGPDLQGDVSGVNRYPGCYTCHGALWVTPTAE